MYVIFGLLTVSGAALSYSIGWAWGVLIVPSIISIIWIIFPRRNDLLPRRIVILLTALMFASLLPGSLSAPIQIIALVGAFAEWLLARPSQRRAGIVVLVAGLFIGYWAILIFHPNIPNFSTGMLGFRKTALAVAAVVLGCAIQHQHRYEAERLVAKLLTLALAVSVVGHLWIPAIPALVSRGDADIYTSLYDGQARLEGVFAGPFHAATAGVLLVGWSMVRWKSGGWLSKVALLVGLVATYLTLVRSAYVAIALCVAAIIIMSTSLSLFMKRFLATLTILGVGVAIAEWVGFRALDMVLSIANFATDGRFLNRLPEYREGLLLFSESPLFGWGAGSAGDTLGPAIEPGQHVTPHNLFLKMMVEGGLVGAMLWIILLVCIWQRINRRTLSGQVAVVALVGLFTAGLTGSAIETLPISYFIFFLAGITLSNAPTKPHVPVKNPIKNADPALPNPIY